jgi:hypothetical protein
MPKGKLLACFGFTLLTCAAVSAQSRTIGATVQGADYDAAKGVTTLHILNTSGKVITFLQMPIIVTFPDGTESLPGSNSMGLEMLSYLIEVERTGHPAEGQGNGGIQPGAVLDYEIAGQPGPVRATVELVAYADGTADVLNEERFKDLVASRKGMVRGLQKANELLNIALADPTIEHPSLTVAAQLKALAAAISQQKYSEAGGGSGWYGLELQVAAQNIQNRWQDPAGRSDLEDSQLRELIKRHEEEISLIVPHTELREAQP